jgi:hypothetical protein
MVRPGAKPSDSEIEAAIGRVLKAEQDARDATAAARDEAATRIDAARSAARALAHRAERRISRIRRAFEQRVRAAQCEIDAEIAALARSAGEDPHVLRREADAVEILAAELTGGDRD